MTLEEAKALVLREGFAEENAPEGAVFILLQFGDVPSRERMAALLKALDIICDGLQGNAVMDKSLAAGLWTLGNMANDCILAHENEERPWRDGALDELIELILAVECVFYGLPSEGLKIKTEEQ